MNRRQFLKVAPAVLASVPFARAISGYRRTSPTIRQLDSVPLAKTLSGVQILPPSFPTVLKDGRAFYRGKWQNLIIGIDTQGKIGILPQIPEESLVIDLGGKTIAPGFIDILADDTLNPEKTYTTFEKFKVTDGVTTALQMHGGSDNCKDYYQYFSARPHYVNYGVSVFVMRIRNTHRSLADRSRLVEKNLDEGALGVSHSIEYQPTPYEELLDYAKLAKKYERPFFLHLRYSSREKELDGVDEGIKLARESGARVHFDHLHSTGGTFNMEKALEKIRRARQKGLQITICVYPYSYWATYLHSKRFSGGWRERYGLDFNDLRLVGTDERLTAESFAKYRKRRTLVAVPEGTMPLDKTVDMALKEDFCIIGSDGGIEYEVRANSHPRGAGCFSTAVRHALDIGMPLEAILDKMTSLPGSLINPAMKNRGVIENGAMADLTVFDPDSINGKASVENPNQYSVGIDMVVVNGQIAYQSGKLITENGKAIRYY